MASRVMIYIGVLRNCLLAAGLIIACSTLAAADNQTTLFDIEAQPLTRALETFARQAHVSINLPIITYKDGKNSPLKGRHSPERGLKELLRGSNFFATAVSSNAFLIRRKRKDASRKETSSVQVNTDIPDLPYVEEILISSTRRVTNLDHLPYSASVILLSDEEQFGSLNTGDMAYRTANLYVTHQERGRKKILMRGMSDGIFNGRVQSLVNTYLDDTRLTHSSADPGLSSLDVERIEILRGPQGTLYGSGSIGGLYRIVTNKPKLDATELKFSSSAASTAKGGWSHDHAAIFNLPVSKDQVALRIAGLYKKNSGYIDDVRLGLTDINDSAEKSARLSLKVAPSDFWSLNLAGNFQRFHASDSSYYSKPLGEFKRDNYLREPANDDFDLYSATLNADLGWAKITSATSWLKRNISTVLDATKFEREPEEGYRPSPFLTTQKIETISNETHIQSPGGNRFEWIVGSYWSHRRENNVARLTIPGTDRTNWNTIAGEPISYQPSAPLYGDTRYLEDMRATQREFGLFGEAIFHVNSKLALTIGGRWFLHKNTADSWSYNDTQAYRSFSFVTICRDLGFDHEYCFETRAHQFFGLTDKQKESDFVPKFLISYSVADNLLVFGQYSKGYRLGGINTAGPNVGVTLLGLDETLATKSLLNFQSDSLTTYELGIKYQSPNNNLKLDVSSYLSNWRNIQSYQFTFGAPPRLENVGSAQIWGVDLEFFYKPRSSQTLRATAGWNTSKITETTSHFGTANGANSFDILLGERLPGAPHFTTGISFTQEFTMWNTPATFEVSYNYIADTKLLFNKVINTSNANSYHLLHARFGVDLDSFQLSLFIKNLLNSQTNIFPLNNPFNIDRHSASENPIQFHTAQTSSPQVTPLRPRTIGLSLSWYY